MQSNTSGPLYRYGLPAVLSVLLHGPLLIGAPALDRAPAVSDVVNLSIIRPHKTPEPLVRDLPRNEPEQAPRPPDKTAAPRQNRRNRTIVALPRVSRQDLRKRPSVPAEASLLYAAQDHPPAPQRGVFTMPSLDPQSGRVGPDRGTGTGGTAHSIGEKVISFDTLEKKRARADDAKKTKKPGSEKPLTPAGLGFKFDFFKPADFNQSIAQAERKAAQAERAFQQERQTNLGHGVICNKKGHWFLCEDSRIDRCNATYDGLCRYAKAHEKRKLSGISPDSK